MSASPTQHDVAAMRQALRAARPARGRTFPNPPVGAVVYRGAKILARGCTRPVGGAHAEVMALDRAQQRHGARALRGASLAVTLEPCSFEGRTPPCVDRVLESGVGRVVVGHRDPHPRVDGRGTRQLRRRGLEVVEGVLEDACREQHRGFLSVVERGRPFVVVKLAATLDGRIATASGESQWITGEPARAKGHALRARSDAVLVGVETALADDPELTARRAGRVVHRPVRVVADTRLRLSPDARLVRSEPASAWVLCGTGPAASRRRALEAAGARVLEVARGRGRGRTSLDLGAGLKRLAREGITEILVEGGGGIAASLLRGGWVDELHWFAAPALLGSDGRPALGPLGLSRLADAPRLEVTRVRRVGDDLHWVARPAVGASR
ncbi:MAG: bifunctional diaminohydroxyphosphoribosylaminopyrimidine deaminase/5-amino-6-(5-phosphoribosylamino)uracil reductase RibD [Myxococcota bacterium]